MITVLSSPFVTAFAAKSSIDKVAAVECRPAQRHLKPVQPAVGPRWRALTWGI